MAEKLPPPAECANCGAAIPRGAKACPECGADERTGWRETSVYDGVVLPDEAFDEAPPKNARRSGPSRRHVNDVAWYWWAVGVGVLLVFALGVLALL